MKAGLHRRLFFFFKTRKSPKERREVGGWRNFLDLHLHPSLHRRRQTANSRGLSDSLNLGSEVSSPGAELSSSLLPSP
ncbi:hypothetical protein DPEC_G00350410 [Dallia pectoralis]|uniref:Uncharacterized protein n=1 Tax=Dallia pectoralis TaxID=75939 RepID=A0ACC2F1R6_DALPE|nr:hypothetical protein DPEC_G00350410 [Dallia pectoralis]